MPFQLLSITNTMNNEQEILDILREALRGIDFGAVEMKFTIRNSKITNIKVIHSDNYNLGS